MLDMKKIFDLDALPYFFGANASRDTDSSFSKVNEAAKVLTDMIWEAGGFRFSKSRTRYYEAANDVSLYFHCSQDKDAFDAPVEITRKRNRLRMRLSSCRSSLVFVISLESWTLTLTLKHLFHPPYYNKNLSQDVLAFIYAFGTFQQIDGVDRVWEGNGQTVTNLLSLAASQFEYLAVR